MACNNYRFILPKPMDFDEESSSDTNEKRLDKINFYDSVSLLRREVENRNDVRDPANVKLNRKQLAKMKFDILKDLEEEQSIEIKPQEQYYIWKCVFLPNLTFRLLENIEKKQTLSHWYIRCLLEGVRSEAVIHRGLAIWEREGKLSTSQLKSYNAQLKDAEKVTQDDDNLGPHPVSRNVDKTQQLQRVIDSMSAKYDKLFDEHNRIRSLLLSKEQVIQDMNEQNKQLREEKIILEKEIDILRKNEEIQKHRISILEKSCTPHFSISTPCSGKKRKAKATEDKSEKGKRLFESAREISEIGNENEQNNSNEVEELINASLNSTLPDAFAAGLLRYHESCEDQENITQEQEVETQPQIETDERQTKNTYEILKVEEIKEGAWVIVEYEGEFFCGKVLSVVNGQTQVRCLEKPYGVWGAQDFEREEDAIFYETVYKSPKEPRSGKFGRKWQWFFEE